ncbi:LysR family transcriptional regulator [Pseudoduganella sp. FT26W]|uniref:LysR family transcriptional regulator n=1 Tax=Duganella aquatilis TaxID=2666082 RepID=A0A844CX34_9BURK|nr:LysR family transcriptional regulator [Duganella aquatilis]MRW85357.1 LysR family transcriptional regulator [Duganella aquatilis]
MDATWLEDFVAVIREGGFSRAADQRAISQPAFSRRIRCLEEWVGTPLFDRTARSVQLTPAGERLKPFAEEILRQLETGRRDALNAAQTSTETLLFASTHALSLTFFPPWLRALESRQALMSSIQLTADSMQGCERLMIDGRAQFLLCHVHPAAASHLSADRFRSVVLGEDVLMPVAAPSLAGTGALENGPFLAYSDASGMGRILRAAWEEGRRPPLAEPAFSSHLASVLAMMARDGRGVSWSPLSLVADDLQAGRLVQLGGAEDEVRMEIHLFRPRARQLRAAERFWEQVQERVAQSARN